jgi:hypothetical protein
LWQEAAAAIKTPNLKTQYVPVRRGDSQMQTLCSFDLCEASRVKSDQAKSNVTTAATTNDSSSTRNVLNFEELVLMISTPLDGSST